jgi:hypothetical protein
MGSKGKKAKEHRKRVEARNNRLKQEKNKIDKMKREFIMNLIKQEQEKGMFENNPAITPITPLDVPQIDPTIEGPQI